MGRILATSMLLLAVVVSACGGATAPTTERVKRVESCAARRITTPPYREGVCVHKGRRYVVENGRSAVHLRTVTVALRYFTEEEEIKGTIPQQGAFLLARMKVQNTTTSPQHFRPGQTSLQFDGRQFKELNDVEHGHQDALAGRTIAPGAAVEGVVVYDVAPRIVTAILRAGVLYIAGFEPQRKDSELGIFRLGDASHSVAIRGR